jgi:hypothetical protein
MTGSFEFLIGLLNLVVGLYYVANIIVYNIFEAIIYGFIIIEAPEIMLKYLKMW